MLKIKKLLGKMVKIKKFFQYFILLKTLYTKKTLYVKNREFISQDR